MKYLCVILVLLFSEPAFAQKKKEKETRVPCIAYWKKGEEKTYLITRKKEKTTAGKSSGGENFLIDAKITVLDSTAEAYTVQWVYGIPPEVDKNSLMGQAAALMQGMKFIYKTDDVGSFTELINWEEVREFYVNMLKLQLQGREDTELKKIMDQTLALFQTREAVESTMIREIQLFQAPFGLMFSTKDTSLNMEIPVPIANAQLPAIQSWRITEVGADGDNFRLVITQNIDPAGAAKVIEGFLKNFTPTEKADAEEMRKTLTSFKVDDFSEYKFIQSTGWLKEYSVTRTANVGNVTQIESYRMELRAK
jgi:hypothetical protein